MNRTENLSAVEIDIVLVFFCGTCFKFTKCSHIYTNTHTFIWSPGPISMEKYNTTPMAGTHNAAGVCKFFSFRFSVINEWTNNDYCLGDTDGHLSPYPNKAYGQSSKSTWTINTLAIHADKQTYMEIHSNVRTWDTITNICTIFVCVVLFASVFFRKKNNKSSNAFPSMGHCQKTTLGINEFFLVFFFFLGILSPILSY